MGDAVNLASRLEGITKEYGADIIVGEDTKKAVPEVVFREIDRVRVKGKDTAVAIFEPLGLEGEVDEGEARRSAPFSRGAWSSTANRNGTWQSCDCSELKTISPDAHLYDIFLERIAILRVNPPGPGWDGAFTFQTK